MEKFFARLGTVGELFSFLWKRKLYWLLPMMVILTLFGALIVLGSAGGGLTPFLYTLF